MSRIEPQYLNFTAGEWSPRLHGRYDLQRYYNAAKTIEEFIVLQQGGVAKRPGSVYKAETKASGKVRLVPFEFNTEQAYVLEFGVNYIRFYRNGGQIESGGSPYEIVTTYAEADLFDLQFAQSADVLWVVHPSYKPQKVTRTGHTAWSIGNYAPTADPFTSTDNYPSCVTFYEQRIVFAATNTAPSKIFFSKSANFEDLTTGVSDDDAFTLVLASGRVNRIRWIEGGGGKLQIGTAGDEYVEQASTNEPITPTNVDIHPQTNFGSANLQPVLAQNKTLFVQRSAKRIREFAFVFENDAFQAPDLTILSEHLFGHAVGGAWGCNDTTCQIVQLAYLREPIPALLAVTNEGFLHFMTYEREQNVVGWSTHFTNTRDFVESVSVIPGTGGDEVWVSVKRTIDGSVVRYVEQLHTGWTDLVDAIYSDSALTYYDPKTITGVTQAVPAVVTTSGAHGYSEGDTVVISEVVGMTELNGNEYRVSNPASTTFELESFVAQDTDPPSYVDIDSTGFTAYGSAGVANKKVTILTGLDHLEGEWVSVMGDGASQPWQTVASGQITLASAVVKAHVGLPYTATLETLPLAQQGQGALGRILGWGQVSVLLHNTAGVYIQGEQVIFRNAADDVNTAVPLFTGMKELDDLGWDTDQDNTISIQSSEASPCTIVAIRAIAEVSDE